MRYRLAALILAAGLLLAPAANAAGLMFDYLFQPICTVGCTNVGGYPFFVLHFLPNSYNPGDPVDLSDEPFLYFAFFPGPSGTFQSPFIVSVSGSLPAGSGTADFFIESSQAGGSVFETSSTGDWSFTSGSPIGPSCNPICEGTGIWVLSIIDAPEPATLGLVGIALAGLGFSRRRKLS